MGRSRWDRRVILTTGNLDGSPASAVIGGKALALRRLSGAHHRPRMNPRGGTDMCAAVRVCPQTHCGDNRPGRSRSTAIGFGSNRVGAPRVRPGCAGLDHGDSLHPQERLLSRVARHGLADRLTS